MHIHLDTPGAIVTGEVVCNHLIREFPLHTRSVVTSEMQRIELLGCVVIVATLGEHHLHIGHGRTGAVFDATREDTA